MSDVSGDAALKLAEMAYMRARLEDDEQKLAALRELISVARDRVWVWPVLGGSPR